MPQQYLLDCRHTPVMSQNYLLGEWVMCPHCKRRRKVIDARAYAAPATQSQMMVDVTRFGIKLQKDIRLANSRGIDFDIAHAGEMYVVAARHGFKVLSERTYPSIEAGYAHVLDFLVRTVGIARWQQLR